MHLNTAIRTRLVQSLLHNLQLAVPGSSVQLRGSLAEGRADAYSDIDLLWEVPDARFDDTLEHVHSILSSVQPIASLRLDPDFQRSQKRRLVFVRFRELPLFWRLDLDILAQSLRRNLNYDVDNPEARGSTWSLTESALANVVAAIKAHLRRQEQLAKQLLLRAYERTGVPRVSDDVAPMIFDLIKEIKRRDPETSDFGAEIMKLTKSVWPGS